MKNPWKRIFPHSNQTNLSKAEETAIQQLIDRGTLTPELQDMFLQIRHLEGINFAAKAYSLLVKHMGYEGAAPKILPTKSASLEGAWDFLPGQIKVEESLFTKPKSQMLCTLWHEFQHFIQDSDIVRTEGKGVNALIKAHIKAVINNLKNNSVLCKKQFNKPLEQITEADFSSLGQSLERHWPTDINMSLYHRVTDKKGIIRAGSSQAAKVEADLSATANYVYAQYFLREGLSYPELNRDEQRIFEKYATNPKEVEAQKTGSRIKAQFEAFMAALEAAKS